MPSAVDEEGGKATSGAAVWLADDPASSLRLALDTLDGNPVPQAEHLLQWALGQLDKVVVLRGHRNWVMSATYSREVGGEENGGRDAGCWVLIGIALVTAVCAAYALLIAIGVL